MLGSHYHGVPNADVQNACRACGYRGPRGALVRGIACPSCKATGGNSGDEDVDALVALDSRTDTILSPACLRGTHYEAPRCAA